MWVVLYIEHENESHRAGLSKYINLVQDREQEYPKNKRYIIRWAHLFSQSHPVECEGVVIELPRDADFNAFILMAPCRDYEC